MSKIALKKAVLEKLKSIEDQNILQSVLNVIDLEQEESKIIFNSEQLVDIEKARKSVRKNGIANKDVFTKTREWLGQ